jgi:hypothetical protein
MKKQTEKKTGSPEKFLAIGIISVMAGLMLLVTVMSKKTTGSAVYVSEVIICISGIILYLALTRNRKARYLFAGLFLFLTGLTFLLISSGLIPYTILQLWPLIVFFCGLSLLGSGFYRREKMRVSHLVPSIALILLGILFLLFSLHIITAHFSVIVSRWWPVALIAAGIVLVLLYISRRKIPADFSILDDGDSIEDNGD